MPERCENHRSRTDVSPPFSSFPQVEQEAFDLKTELRAVQEQCRNERDQIESNDQVGEREGGEKCVCVRAAGFCVV